VVRWGTLKAHQPYLIFEADENMQRFGYSKKELFELIRSAHDYSFYDVEADEGGTFSRVRRVEGAADSNPRRCARGAKQSSASWPD